jgi:hypothetical protein
LEKSILLLKKHSNELKRYQKKLEGGLKKDEELVKKLLREGKRDQAKLVLKNKILKERLLKKTIGQLNTMEKMVPYACQAKLELQSKMLQEELLKKTNEQLLAFEKMVLDKEFAQTEPAADKWNLLNIIKPNGYWAFGGALILLMLFAQRTLSE